MTKVKNIFTLRVILLSFWAMLFGSCISEPDVAAGKPSAGADVYVSSNISTREGTINSSAEDDVKQVRVMVFDSGTGELVVNVPLVTFIQPTQPNGAPEGIWINPIKITSGVRDFFFVANEATNDWNLTPTLNGITHREQLLADPSLNKILFTPGFKPATDGTRAFLMSAVYRNINVSNSAIGTGTQADPYHFLSDNSGNKKVELIRSFAKITLRVKNGIITERTGEDTYVETLESLDRIELLNIPQYHKLFNTPFFVSETQGLYTTQLIPSAYTLTPAMNETPLDNNAEPIAIGAVRTRDYVATIYVPEFLRPVSATPQDAALSFAFYKKGDTRVSAAITHVEFNRQGEYPILLPGEYNPVSVLRNTEYQVNAEWKQKDVSLQYTVLPWTLKESKVEFYASAAQMAYVDNWTPNTLTLKEPGTDVVSFTFRIIQPQGVDWVATLTNGLDFAFREGTPSRGITGDEAVIEIIALKPPGDRERITEFYLTVNGEEIDPDKYIDSWGAAQNGPIGTGAGQRYVIRQLAK